VTDASGRPEPAAGARDGAESFWAGFAARQFRREPAEFDHPPAGFGTDEDELFDLLADCCERRGTGPRQPKARFHLGACEVLADLDDYLPARADRSLDGYLRRLESDLNGQPYLLTVQRTQAVSRPAWKRAAGFLAGLQAAAGALPGPADLEAFVGHYPSTAPGIHRERSGIFVSAVRGAKDILVWPPEESGLPLGTLRYEHATANATRLRCQPGRLVYWPALHWHVGQSPSAPSAALHLAVTEVPDLGDVIARAVDDLTGSPAGPAVTARPGCADPVPDDAALPGRYQTALSALTAQFGDRAAVRDRLTADWLRHRTGLGFTAPPPRYLEVALADTEVIRRDSVQPVLLARRDDATSWCAADGRVADVRTVPALQPLIDLINAGQPARVRDALQLAGDDADRELLRRVLSLLAAWRAVRVI
jgi:50S ribosomal protein L16 3-hydroxylase